MFTSRFLSRRAGSGTSRAGERGEWPCAGVTQPAADPTEPGRSGPGGECRGNANEGDLPTGSAGEATLEMIAVVDGFSGAGAYMSPKSNLGL
jgi:hypothetical protein